MSGEQFTAQAAVLWNTVPRDAKELILKNVFCVECSGITEMVQFTGKEQKNGDLILKGKCAKCGHEVVRILETGELHFETN